MNKTIYFKLSLIMGLATLLPSSLFGISFDEIKQLKQRKLDQQRYKDIYREMYYEHLQIMENIVNNQFSLSIEDLLGSYKEEVAEKKAMLDELSRKSKNYPRFNKIGKWGHRQESFKENKTKAFFLPVAGFMRQENLQNENLSEYQRQVLNVCFGHITGQFGLGHSKNICINPINNPHS
ncbi:MAG: hypothetical protein WDZ41_01020 [Candidatus Babeliales bacterium]